MVKFAMRETSHTTKIIIFIAWLFPIFFIPQVQGFLNYGWDVAYAKTAYVLPVFLGVAFFVPLILLGKKMPVNRYALALLLFIYGHTLLSDVGEYVQVFYFALYGLVVHLIGYNYPKVLFRQYFAVCGFIAALVVADYLKYYITGSTICNWHRLTVLSGIPRIHTFFNEPAHLAVFLMPALFYRLFCDRKGFDVWLAVLLFAYLATLSVMAIVLLTVVVTYYYIGKRRISIPGLFVGFVVSMVVINLGGDFILSKLSTTTNVAMYYNRTKGTSGSNYIAMIDIAKNTELNDLVFGVGYFNVGMLFADYLKQSNLSSYYFSQGFYEGDYTSSALVRWLYSFGVLGEVVIWFLVIQMLRSSKKSLISIIVIVCIILVSIKESHALDNLVFLFFFFGLFWGNGRRNRKALQLESNWQGAHSTEIPCRSSQNSVKKLGRNMLY